VLNSSSVGGFVSASGLVFDRAHPWCTARRLGQSSHVAAAQELRIHPGQSADRTLCAVMVDLSHSAGSLAFHAASRSSSDRHGSVLRRRRELIIFEPIIGPRRRRNFGIAPLSTARDRNRHGVGLFAPPPASDLRQPALSAGAIEVTVKPMMKYLGLIFLLSLGIAFVPAMKLGCRAGFGTARGRC